MISIRLILVLIVFLQVKNCKDTDPTAISTTPTKQEETMQQPEKTMPLDNIVVEYYGGMNGHNQVMIITDDKISFSYKDAKNPKPIIDKIDIPDGLWEKLNKEFNLKEFSTLKSGSSKRVFDGMDYKFTVSGGFGEMSVINPLDYDVEMKNFFEDLKLILQEYNSIKQ